MTGGVDFEAVKNGGHVFKFRFWPHPSRQTLTPGHDCVGDWSSIPAPKEKFEDMTPVRSTIDDLSWNFLP